MNIRKILGDPDHDGSELNESQKAASKLVVTSGNPTKLLELLKETLYQMAFLIKEPVTFPGMLFVGFGWNAVGSTLADDIIADSPCTVCFVC